MIHDALLGRQDNCMAIKCIKKKEHFPFYFHTSSVRCKMKTVVIRDVIKCDFYSQRRCCNDDVIFFSEKKMIWLRRLGLSNLSPLKTFIVDVTKHPKMKENFQNHSMFLFDYLTALKFFEEDLFN